MRPPFSFTFLILCVTAQFSYGQADSISLYEDLDSIVVRSTRILQTIESSSSAITSYDKQTIQSGQALVSINEALESAPGVFSLNAYNFAQDLRVSIRGFGARSAFGIRGVQLLVDGFPESTPDGQAQVDNLDLASIESMEILRGPSSGYYGNASGGVINIFTDSLPSAFFTEGRLVVGSFGLEQYQLKVGSTHGKLAYWLKGSIVNLNGFREHSEMESRLFNSKIRYQINKKSHLLAIFNYADSPLANDPGGVDFDIFNANAAAPRDRNVLFRAGEAVTQGRIGLRYVNDINSKHKISISSHYTFRDFSNRLPFEFGGMVNIDRQFFGINAQYQFSSFIANGRYRLAVGYDFAYQDDARKRFNNMEGIQGDLVFDQQEIASQSGFYVLNDWNFSPNWKLRAGLRLDQNLLEANDRFLADGDESGERNLTPVNPILGLVYYPKPALSVYTNYSSSFETPTLSELSANPLGGGGFNPNLESQKAQNLELGIRGRKKLKFNYEIALFYVWLNDEIIGFELEAFPDREFFRNAGKSSRRGLEASFGYTIAKGLRANLSYTYSDFQFEEFEVRGGQLDGNQLPGIPEHLAHLRISYRHTSGFYTILDSKYVGELFADDANQNIIDDYLVSNWKLGYRKKIGKVVISPFFGINNWNDETYPSNVRINAFGGRFFEGAPERNFYGGIVVRFGD